jgi:ABC-type nitrate/sulfonate/bicarbonate transport system substrate-binding protein
VKRRAFLRLCALAACGALTACGGASAASSTQPGVSAASKPSAPSLAASKPAPSPSGSTQANRPLKISYPAPTAGNAPLWMAEATGAFAAQHIAPNIQLLTGNLGVTALVAKEIDLAQSSAPQVITAELNGSPGIVFVASLLNHGIQALCSAPEVRTGADLKGKIIATDQPGTAGDYALRRILPALGVDRKDLQVRVISGSQNQFTALISGLVQAAVMSPPFPFMAELKGFHILGNIFNEPYQNVGIAVLKSRMDELAPVLPGVLLALRAGIKAYNEQPELAMKLFTQFTGDSDPQTLQLTYDFYKTKSPFEPTLEFTIDGMQANLDTLVPVAPAAATAKPEQFIDRRFLDALPRQS